MRFCPLCRAEFDDPGVRSCGSCECELVAELEPEVELPHPEPPLALLVRAEVASAGIIAAELADHGIRSYIEQNLGIGMFAAAYARILISKQDGPKAGAILEELRHRQPNLKIDYTGQSETPALPGF